jgi:hypothetical protein
MNISSCLPDDAYKIKAYNPDAASSLATATYLGPTFGGCINKLLPFRYVPHLRTSLVTAWLVHCTATSGSSIVAYEMPWHYRYRGGSSDAFQGFPQSSTAINSTEPSTMLPACV